MKSRCRPDGQDLAYVDSRYVYETSDATWKPSCHRVGVRRLRPPSGEIPGISYFRSHRLQNIDEVEFRLSEVYYMLAECEMRAGQADKAKELVNEVRKRYFSTGDWADVKDKPGRGFTAFDMDWMLSQVGC